MGNYHGDRMREFAPLAIIIAVLALVRRDTFRRVLVILLIGLMAYAIFGTGPLAGLCGWLCIPFTFAILSHSEKARNQI
jgi:hypothetical protein